MSSSSSSSRCAGNGLARSGRVAGGMVAVLVAGIVTPEQALAGFSNPAPLTVAALFILARAVEKTGALTPLVKVTLGNDRSARSSLARLVGPTMTASAFLNNTPIVAMLLPEVRSWARTQRKSVSLFLIPLSFAAILGGGGDSDRHFDKPGRVGIARGIRAARSWFLRDHHGRASHCCPGRSACDRAGDPVSSHSAEPCWR